ncbi:hypothetical protein SESBI_12213 [Sesbania bispinosa]|nr:hypothetical protein SESBI_12213 [Sesbania bispinosa]
MALVQKLTGFSHSGDGDESLKSKHGSGNNISRLMEDKESGGEKMIMVKNEDSETTSMITKDNNCNNNIGESQLSCFAGEKPPILEVPMKPCLVNLPVLSPNSTEFMCLSQSWLNFSDSLFFSNNIRTSIPSLTTFEGIEFGDIDYS